MPPTSGEEQGTEKASTSFLKERRFKLSRACDRCRRRRIKCDEGHPCQACLGANSPCTFEEPGKRSHPHKSKRTATLEDRMHHLESLIQAIPPAVFAAGGAEPSCVVWHVHSHLSAHRPSPALNTFPLMNPSTHFTAAPGARSRHSSPNAAPAPFVLQAAKSSDSMDPDHLAGETARMSLCSSYLYVDDEGYTRWQGETSGLPILDLLVERHKPLVPKSEREPSPQQPDWSARSPTAASEDYFPDRMPKRTDIQPEKIWKLITSLIAPDLMDSLVQCYLSTSYYLIPFLHIPTFLADYGNPQKWGEPGFAAFIVAVCCLASRHIDDPRVRADPSDGISSGTQWFELFGRLRTLPAADRPTVYTVQAVLVAGVYAVGWGKLSRAFALIAESITLSMDAGLHRSGDAYDIFDPIENEIRKRTFWCVYMWDKQASAHFGRPPMIRMRDCDVGEPSSVDDEFITHDSVGPQPPDTPSRMSAFVGVLRMFVVLESVLDTPPPKDFGDTSPFLARATGVLAGFRRHKGLREEEALLDEVCNTIPPHWAHTRETMASEDVIRVTHAERLHCLQHFVRMLIMRHRFSEMVAERAAVGEQEQTEAECDVMRVAHASALQIVTAHMHIATKGLMTYYGVHVIHQLTQAGRTLVAFLLNCQSDSLRPLITPALDGLRSCVGLLRRFSGRYVCGLRSGDVMEEFCRITQIPLDHPSLPQDFAHNKPLPPWIRPVRKKHPSAPRSSGSHESPPPPHDSPETFSETFSPTEMFVDMSGVSGPNGLASHFSTINTAQGVAVQPSKHPSTSTSTGAFALDTASGFADPGVAMSPAEIMALFNEGSMDMTSLFGASLSTDMLGDPAGGEALTGGMPFGTAFRKPGSPSDMSGIVASP